jgi:UDP:flavonoid glycosyltransferase YjiC (YdhE family)
VRQRHGPDVHAARLARLVGRRPASRPARPAARRRILFLSSNGVGLGHLTRLLAVARRMPEAVLPVFATMSQAMPIVGQAGYPVEYLPFHHGNVDVADWNDWFALHLGQIIDFHEAAAIVFDGSNPYSGLIKAAARARLPLVWIRRGMWKETQSNDEQIRRQRFFDLVIEPADIADAVDRGATAALRDATLRVPPIRLLDAEELPGRQEAAAALGLDPGRPAVLIQLGAGTNRDIVSLIDAVLGALAQRPEVQPVVAEWLIAPAQLDFWPGVRRLRGFPMSRYYNAFDFTVSAAGYNSFNEIISFGVPAIFIANEHPTMDDQAGRATFAEANGAGFHLPETRAEEIAPMVEALLDERARLLIRANCARLAQDNGAGAAAAAITRLVTGHGMRLSA